FCRTLLHRPTFYLPYRNPRKTGNGTICFAETVSFYGRKTLEHHHSSGGNSGAGNGNYNVGSEFRFADSALDAHQTNGSDFIDWLSSLELANAERNSKRSI